MYRAQAVLRDHQVRQGEQAEQLRRVLDEPLVANLAMVEQVLDDMKRIGFPARQHRQSSEPAGKRQFDGKRRPTPCA